MPRLPDPAAGPGACQPPASQALKDLRAGRHDSYGETRDDYKTPTTRLSVHMKFGEIAPWEPVRIARRRGLAELERQLLWREFYYHLAYAQPGLLNPGAPNRHIRPDRQRAEWGPADPAAVARWLEGETGEPLVDESMRELKETGYIHNRLRMVVSSYLVRRMGVDWRVGERAFATRLADYDPAQNSGGWQSADSQIPGQEIKASAQLKKFGPAPRCRVPVAGPVPGNR